VNVVVDVLPPWVIVPLDVDSEAAALTLASRLDPQLCRVKVGKELFTVAGPGVIKALHARGFKVFLDLKFHDIPNTVGKAIQAASRLGVWMVNVHASGGRAMLQAARAALPATADRPILIAVTVLTSLADADLGALGWQCTAAEQALRLATLAHQEGLDGVVCSAHEVASIKAATSASFLTVTPGIRAEGDALGDQVRVMTPAQARAAGADYLVMGRPITQAPDPALRLAEIDQQLKAA
jgi:orotidine-5'-phosphate decarboxylase